MVKVEKAYVFAAPNGKVSPLDLSRTPPAPSLPFLMYHAREDHFCDGCSFFADQICRLAHLQARDTSFALVARAPIAKITAFKKRMGACRDRITKRHKVHLWRFQYLSTILFLFPPEEHRGGSIPVMIEVLPPCRRSVGWKKRFEVGVEAGRRVYEEALMLTSDENIVEAQMVVQYRVADPSIVLPARPALGQPHTSRTRSCHRGRGCIAIEKFVSKLGPRCMRRSCLVGSRGRSCVIGLLVRD
jgi:Bacterial protein of unknown function (DUF899)